MTLLAKDVARGWRHCQTCKRRVARFTKNPDSIYSDMLLLPCFGDDGAGYFCKDHAPGEKVVEGGTT